MQLVGKVFFFFDYQCGQCVVKGALIFLRVLCEVGANIHVCLLMKRKKTHTKSEAENLKNLKMDRLLFEESIGSSSDSVQY